MVKIKLFFNKKDTEREKKLTRSYSGFFTHIGISGTMSSNALVSNSCIGLSFGSCKYFFNESYKLESLEKERVKFYLKPCENDIIPQLH